MACNAFALTYIHENEAYFCGQNYVKHVYIYIYIPVNTSAKHGNIYINLKYLTFRPNRAYLHTHIHAYALIYIHTHKQPCALFFVPSQMRRLVAVHLLFVYALYVV